MLNDEQFQATQKALKAQGQAKLTKEERKLRQRALDDLGIKAFDQFVSAAQMKRKPTEILQINVGLYCNQACSHCHVESSPKRTEMMSAEVADRCLHILEKSPSIASVDLTGTLSRLKPSI
jgi:sulfatase maturation enzyme AslB (radical SAM superfamily)